MYITEFAESRNRSPQVISKYISRHTDLFEGHIKKQKKMVELDEIAVELLDKAYPLPKPVQIIQGIPKEEHEALQNKYVAQLEIDARKDEVIRQLMEEKTSLLLQMKDLQLLETKVQEFEKKNWFEKMRYKFGKA